MGGCSLRWCYSHLIYHPPGRRGDLALVLVVGSQAWILLLAPPFITANNCKAFCSRSVLRKRDRVKSFCRAVVAVRQNLCEYLSRVYLYAVNKKELPILCKPWFWTWWIVRCFFFSVTCRSWSSTRTNLNWGEGWGEVFALFCHSEVRGRVRVPWVAWNACFSAELLGFVLGQTCDAF